MIILFPVPMWFVIAGLIVSVMFVIYEMIEDAEIVADARHAREAADRAHEAQRPELDRLLSRLARAHGIKGATYKVWTPDELRQH